MEGALRLMDVPPDDIQSWLAAQASGKIGHAANILPTVPEAQDLPDPAAEFDAALPTAAAAPAQPQEARQ